MDETSAAEDGKDLIDLPSMSSPRVLDARVDTEEIHLDGVLVHRVPAYPTIE